MSNKVGGMHDATSQAWVGTIANTVLAYQQQIAVLESSLKSATEMLRRLGSEFVMCPSCQMNHAERDHAPGCELAAFLEKGQ